jgi:hypothetical protein
MPKPKFTGALLCSLLVALSVNAQQSQTSPPPSPLNTDKPVWALEFVKVKPGMFAATMGYLDDDWIRLRAEAKRQGAVLSYHRVAGEESSNSDWDILLMTEYKNRAPLAWNRPEPKSFAEAMDQHDPMFFFAL